MDIKGKVIHILPLQSGVGQSGKEWKKQEFVIETQDQYPKKVCFGMFGDRIDQYPMTVGEDVIVNFDVESREYNGRWYTNVNAWRIEKEQNAMPANDGGAPIPPFEPEGAATDDLPF